MSSVNTSAQPSSLPSVQTLPLLAPPIASTSPAAKHQPPVDAVAPSPAAPVQAAAATTLEEAPAPAERRQSPNQRFRAWAEKVWIQLCNKLFGRR